MSAVKKRFEICIVEDEAELRDELVEVLLEAGYGVRGFSGSRELYAALLTAPCDLVILDIGLPGEDGFSIAERIHSLGSMGIIMLTARSGIEDRVRALGNCGADTYLTKPVDLRELQAVIVSLMRRLSSSDSRVNSLVEAAPTPCTLSSDGWALLGPDGITLSLTAQERTFLQYLWKRIGEAVPREELAVAMGGNPFDYDFHRIDTMVSRMRRKAAEAGLTLPLHSVRGAGYLIASVSERGAV